MVKILSRGRKHIAYAPQVVTNQTSKETKVTKITLSKCRKALLANRKETTATTTKSQERYLLLREHELGEVSAGGSDEVCKAYC